MQPDLLRRQLDLFFSTQEVDETVRVESDPSATFGSTDFSSDFETFGQFIHRKHLDRSLVDKYSNIGL